MSDKTKEAQAFIDPLVVARMQIEFGGHFKDVYDIPNLCMMGVGPMQSFLGHMVRQGYIEVKIDRAMSRPQAKRKWWFW